MYQGKTILITGTSRGIGNQLAIFFLNEGAKVIGFSRGGTTIENINYRHFSLNIGSTTEIINTFKILRQEKLNIDILINNAAVLTSQYSIIIPAKNVEDMINVNFKGAFLITRESAKLMRKSKYGRIINISSMAVVLEPMGDAIYAATKAAITSVCNILAKEFSSMNITCNTIGITAIETDMLNSHTPSAKIKIKEIIENLPIPRVAKIEDILHVIKFFGSEESSYITAQTIYLGGLHS